MYYGYSMTGLQYELWLPCKEVSVRWPSQYIYTDRYDKDYLYEILYILPTSILQQLTYKYDKIPRVLVWKCLIR